MEERVWHYVRSSEAARIPRRHIFLDTEARTTRTRTGHRQDWRVGVAAFHAEEKGRPTHDTLRVFRDAPSLWAAVSTFTKPRNRTVLWAHNLAYDVRIADAFRALPALGWSLGLHNLASRGTWLSWQRNGASLVMVDATSVYPAPLATLGKSFMHEKLPLPDNDASLDQWTNRCVRDVEILRQAVLTYLSWIEEEGLGNWALTGAGQSFAAFRSRFMTDRMLVHTDQDALDAERRAMWTGRCEAYWRGNTGHSGVEEWDFELNYPRLARDNLLPTHIIGPIGPSADLAELLATPRTAVLARVEVQTSMPIVPAEVGGRVAWPVGRFETTLWDPELRLALESGASVRVIHGWRYHTTPALKKWAEWIIDGLATSNTETPAWKRIILKHWARALPGRFGMSYTKWSKLATTTNHQAFASTVYDTSTGEEYELTHLGDAIMRSDGTVEWAQSMPAITGYIMSLSRVLLYRVCEAMPPQSVLYVDTDSFYIRSAHHNAAVAVAHTPLGEGLRLKHTYRRAQILGPRQVIVDGRHRIAGVSSKAELLANGKLSGEVWASLQFALQRGDPSAVTITNREWTVRGVDHRRTGPQRGWTHPVTVGGGE